MSSTSSLKPLLVGEVNPYGADPEMALYPLPEHAAGGRLARILGLSHGEYLRRFDRVNLCTGAWSLPAARQASYRYRLEGQPKILLGRKVAQAFGYEAGQPFEKIGDIYLMPHPSGRCRIWNRPGAHEKVRALLHDFLGQPCMPHSGTDGEYHPECERCRNVTQMAGGTL